MTKVTIIAEDPGNSATRFRALAKNLESVGPTVGTALDALTAQLDDSSVGTLVIVQNLKPDEFFSSHQQKRLEQLLDEMACRA